MLLNIYSHKSSRCVQVGTRHLREHDLHVVDDVTSLTVRVREDGVGPAEADVGLVDVVEHRLVDAQSTGQGVHELRGHLDGFDADEDLDSGTANLDRQSLLSVEDGVGLSPQLLQVDLWQFAGQLCHSLEL